MKTIRFIFYTTLGLVYAQTGLANLEVSCIGRGENHKLNLIYMHGMDTQQPGELEIYNRSVLESLALRYNLQIALPRAPLKCKTQTNKRCWGWNYSEAEQKPILKATLDSRLKCFKKDEAFLMIGFSEGGLFLHHWYSRGLLPAFDVMPKGFIVSAGSTHALSKQLMADLHANSPMVLVTGTHDYYNMKSVNDYYAMLEKARASVQSLFFNGGHRLDFESLNKAYLFY